MLQELGVCVHGHVKYVYVVQGSGKARSTTCTVYMYVHVLYLLNWVESHLRQLLRKGCPESCVVLQRVCLS